MSKSDLSQIEATVRKNLNRSFPGQQSLKFVMGVSGGVDSMCLLYIFNRLNIPVLVSHVNYKKRGEASERDAELVEQMAYQWGYECHTAEVDPADNPGENFQQWARELRYGVFKSLQEEYKADGIVVAHHEDDQIETILQKIFRGAGLASWAGMEVWDGEVFRPFLTVSRTLIEQFAKKKAIPYRLDRSNLASVFARNFLRNEWLERLPDFFPGWRQNVLRINEYASNYEKALEWVAARLTGPGGIDREGFHSLDLKLQKALTLYLLKEREAGVKVSHHSLQQLEQLPDLQTGKAIQLTEKYSMLRDREHYWLVENQREKFAALTFERKQLERSPAETSELEFSVEDFHRPDFEEHLYLDADKITWPVTVRTWIDGDRFQPLGMKGHQLVSDHLTNRKISAARKDEALVVESFEQKICAIIFPPIKNQSSMGTISEQVRCNARTKSSLVISTASIK